VQDREPGCRRDQDKRVRESIESGACRRRLAEAARNVAVQDVGQAGNDEPQRDQASAAPQRSQPQGWQQDDAAEGQACGHGNRAVLVTRAGLRSFRRQRRSH
jgi:hypothetical protein